MICSGITYDYSYTGSGFDMLLCCIIYPRFVIILLRVIRIHELEILVYLVCNGHLMHLDAR